MAILFGRDSLASRAIAGPRRTFSDAYARASQPGPAMEVQPFSGAEVTTPAALLRLGTAIFAGARNQANYEQAQKVQQINDAFKLAEINRMTVPPPRTSSWTDANGVVHTGLTSEEASTLQERADASGRLHRSTPAADRTVSINGTSVTGLTASQQASTLARMRGQDMVGHNQNAGLADERQVLSASRHIAEIDRNLGPRGPLRLHLQADASNQGQSLLDDIYPATGKPDPARKSAALQALRLDPRAKYSTPDDQKLVFARAHDYSTRVFNTRFSAASDSLMGVRSQVEDQMNGASSRVAARRATSQAIQAATAGLDDTGQ